MAVPAVGRVPESVLTKAGPDTVTVIDSFAVSAAFFCLTQIVAAGVLFVDAVDLVATTVLSVPSFVPFVRRVWPVLKVEVDAAVAATSAAVTVTVHVTEGPATPSVAAPFPE
jgi:hypothetical protein